MTDVSHFRRSAEDLARGRKERPSTGHLLVTLAEGGGPEKRLLAERRLDRDVLLQAVRVAQDDDATKLNDTLSRARELAGRSTPAARGASPGAVSGLHVLFALCQEPKSAAYRMLAQLGVDIGKLRTQAMQIATGVVAVPRESRMPTPDPVRRQELRALGTTVAMPLRPPETASRPAPAPKTRPLARTLTPRDGSKHQEPGRSPIKPEEPGRSATTAKTQESPKRREPRRREAKIPHLSHDWSEQLRQQAPARPVGRNKEISRALDALAKLEGNSPVLLGGAGIGKTATLLGVALALLEMRPEARLMCLSPARLANMGVRTGFVSALDALEEGMSQGTLPDALFVDDLPALLTDYGDDLASRLRLLLQRPDLPCLVTCTPEGLRALEARDPMLVRALSAIELEELGETETLAVLEARREALEAHHAVRIPAAALQHAVRDAARYVARGAMPEKALQLVDLAAARASRASETELSRRTLAEVVSELAEVPIERLLETDQERMLQMESLVGERLVGHHEAVSRIARVLRRNATGLGGGRPIGVFLLLGPTGVGKTETAKAIAECLFHSEHAMTRLDLSEYAEAHAVARLVGAPPGYLGHEAGGQLTEAVRKRPYQVVLLDEIEKAHRDVLEAFLGVFDEGRMTDGRGRLVSFENTVIFLTSNLGADVDVSQKERSIGFGAAAKTDAGANRARYQDAVLERARAALPPELINRFDETLVFAPLDRAAVREVAVRMLRHLQERLLSRQGIGLEVTDAAVEHLLDQGGFDPRYGARPMRRTIARLVEAELSERILRGEIVRDGRVQVHAEDGELVFSA